MSFGKESSFMFVMEDGVLVNVGRADVTADKKPLDSVELEVWRIFHEHKALQARHEKLVEAWRKIGRQIAYLKTFDEGIEIAYELEEIQKETLKQSEQL